MKIFRELFRHSVIPSFRDNFLKNRLTSFSLLLLLVSLLSYSCQKDVSSEILSNSNEEVTILGKDKLSYKHESIGKILSLVLKSSAGQSIFLNSLSENITEQTDSTIAGLYSIPLIFLMNEEHDSQKFYSIWDSIALTVDSTCNTRYLFEDYFHAFPAMGLSIFDPQEGLEKYLTNLDTDFQVACSVEFLDDSITMFRNGANIGKVGFMIDPVDMTVIVQENEGYWLLTGSQVSSRSDFFEATGIDLCDYVIELLPGYDINILGGAAPGGGANISLGGLAYSNPLQDYTLLLRADVFNVANTNCDNDVNDDPEVIIRSGDCDRDLWDEPNHRERIIRFKIPTAAAKNVLLTGSRCAWLNHTCTFLIVAHIPKYDGNLSDAEATFYGRSIPKHWSCERKWLKNLNWMWTHEIAFSEWNFNEGRMGSYWVYDIIQKNKKEGTEVTISGNAKFSGGVEFNATPEIDGVETEAKITRNVEAGIGITVKYTHKDWPLGADIVDYCHCQDCNGWQGETYGTGQLSFSVRECNSMPNCLNN